MRSILKNKRAAFEFSPAVLAIIAVMVFIVVPVIFMVVTTTTTTFFGAMNTTAPDAVAQGQSAVDNVYRWMDTIVLIGFTINVIVLLISAYFIDVNPVFIVLYIFFAFLLILITPNALDVADKVWAADQIEVLADGTLVTDHLPMTDWIRNNFILFLLTIIIMSGLITYAKIRSNNF